MSSTAHNSDGKIVPKVDVKAVAEVLRHLVEICIDTQHGFAIAARGMDDPLMKAELLQYSFQRQRFVNQLTEAAWDMGVRNVEQQDVGKTGKWVDIKQAIQVPDKHLILQECERSEDLAIRIYHDVRYGVLPVNVASLVHSQANAVQRVLDRIRYLRESGTREMSH